MIRSFADRRTARIFDEVPVKGVSRDLARRTRLRLADLDVARDLGMLAARRGNRLEALRGNRAGQWSIRVNDQWRICFVWRDSDVHDVELVDYH